jgi:hypothetical protein
MKTTYAIYLVLFCLELCNSSGNTNVCIISSTLRGKEMTATVTLDAFRKAPLWNDTQQPPPLNVETAISKAENFAKAFKTDSQVTEVGDIAIKRLGNAQYIYIVQVFFYTGAKREGFSTPLNVVVLMDGTVIDIR